MYCIDNNTEIWTSELQENMEKISCNSSLWLNNNNRFIWFFASGLSFSILYLKQSIKQRSLTEITKSLDNYIHSLIWDVIFALTPTVG